MNVKDLAEKSNCSARTVQRWFVDNDKGKFGLKDEIPKDIVSFYFKTKLNGFGKPNPDEDIAKFVKRHNELKLENKGLVSRLEEVESESKVMKQLLLENDKNNLERILSSDSLVMVVLAMLLILDMFSYGVVGKFVFGDVIDFAGTIFASIGFVAGVGSIVTHNRMNNKGKAVLWKWFFGILQFSVFILAINHQWFFAEIIMTVMIVSVFIGVQSSIKE